MDRLLTDEQWAKIQPLLPTPRRSRRGGRPRAPDRPVFEGTGKMLDKSSAG